MTFPYSNIQTPPEYFDSEVARLRTMLDHDCPLHYDPQHVLITVGEWQRDLMNDMVEFFVEENMLSTELKQAVRIKGLENRGTISYGLVAANYAVYIQRMTTFEGLDAFDVMETGKRPINHERQAELIFVRWFGEDGTEICSGWHNADTLEAY